MRLWFATLANRAGNSQACGLALVERFPLEHVTKAGTLIFFRSCFLSLFGSR